MNINKPLRHAIAAAAIALTGMAFTSAVLAQESEVQKQFEAYKASAKNLSVLLNKPVTDAAGAAALEKDIDAETKKKQAAEEGIQAGMQKLDEKNPQHGKLVEQVFGEIQKTNAALASQQLKTNEAIAKAKQQKK